MAALDPNPVDDIATCGNEFESCQNSRCCKSGLECYRQDAQHAQCLLPGTCSNKWSCEVVTRGYTRCEFTCAMCPAGTFSGAYGAFDASACNACPSGSWSPPGSTAASNCTCLAGYTGQNGQVCQQCPAGTYKASPGSAGCTSCPAGTFSTSVGSTSSGACQACPANTESAAGSASPSDCVASPGFTGPDGGPCIECAAGSFKTASGSGVCETCAANTFSATVAATDPEECVACPTHSSAPAGSTNVSSCTCNAGFAGPSSGPCTMCLAGTWCLYGEV